MNTVKKKLFFLSGKGGSPAPVNPGQSLFDAYKARVEADSGTVQNDAATLGLFDAQVTESLKNNLIFQIDSRAGNRLTSGNTNRAYSLDPNNNDISQDVASRQPALTTDGYVFDGASKFLTRPAILGQHTSLNVWFQKKSNQTFRGIIGQYALSIDGSFGIYSDSDGQSIAVVNTNSFSLVNIPVNNDTWYMVSVDMDSSTNAVRVYLNGSEVSGQSYIPIANPNSSFSVGRLRSDSIPGNPWNGFIDGIKVWNDRSFTDQFYLDTFNNEKGRYGIS